jgi:hypothetical protein
MHHCIVCGVVRSQKLWVYQNGELRIARRTPSLIANRSASMMLLQLNFDDAIESKGRAAVMWAAGGKHFGQCQVTLRVIRVVRQCLPLHVYAKQTPLLFSSLPNQSRPS